MEIEPAVLKEFTPLYSHHFVICSRCRTIFHEGKWLFSGKSCSPHKLNQVSPNPLFSNSSNDGGENKNVLIKIYLN